MPTTSTVSVATVLTLGLSPRRARLKMVMGMVVEPGPDRKADNTTSSRDNVKVSSQAEAMACEISGRVTKKNTCQGRQPRSCAASSRLWLISCKRDCTTTVA